MGGSNVKAPGSGGTGQAREYISADIEIIGATEADRKKVDNARGPGRYRAVCPVCGERNASTLSVGETPQGAVLIRCFKMGCSIDCICGALGLEVSDLFPPRESFRTPMARRRLLSDRQALDLAHDEVQFVAVMASNMARGIPATDDDCQRALQAAGRLAYLCQEARS